MRCETVAIGTELLLGQIVDTNAAWIGERLALAGIDRHRHTTVGDNLGRMEAALREALARADAVICCGGLGPTQDDITRDAIARVMGVRLVRDHAIVARIAAMFSARGRTMTANNLRQADIPEGARAIEEMPGTAPGMICPVGEKAIYALPGVPFEMKAMMESAVLPDLTRRRGAAAVIRSRVLKTWGLGESGLAEALDGRLAALDAVGNPTLAFQASGIEGIKVRITAKAADEARACALLDSEEALVRAAVGEHVFAVDGATMESAILDLMRSRGWRLAACESLTGGVLASRMTAADPGGEVFRGAIVAAGKEGRAEPAQAMEAAREARARFGVELGIAAADAGAEPDAPRGAVRLAFSRAGEERQSVVALPGDRRRLRAYAVVSLLDFVRRALARE